MQKPLWIINMHCFFKISVAGASHRKIVFELDESVCPVTCNNFLQICKSKSTAKRLGSGNKFASSEVLQPTYRGTEIHRIVPNFMIQGGDFTSFDGKGGYAHPSTNKGLKTFADENFSISHSSEGILSMANRGKNTNGSQFFITLNKCLHLDGKHVAFGKVVQGMDVVREIARVETEGDKPVKMQRVIIVDCGEGWGEQKNDSSNQSYSSQSTYRNKKKKHHRHKQKKHIHSIDKKKRKHYKRSREKDNESSSDEGKRKHSKKKRRKEKSKSNHRRTDRDASSLDSSGSDIKRGH